MSVAQVYIKLTRIRVKLPWELNLVSRDPESMASLTSIPGIHSSWSAILSAVAEECAPEWRVIMEILAGDHGEFLPARDDVFRVFRGSIDDIRVVILGQDPYHTPGIADGLAFSSRNPSVIPPSLRNIFREIGCEFHRADLSAWAAQGVLLLNTALTVRPHEPNSHAKYWSKIVDSIIRRMAIHTSRRQMIYCLWGAHAQKKEKIVDESGGNHVVLKAVHPSPLSASRGWFGSDHFGAINRVLVSRGERVIDWSAGLA